MNQYIELAVVDDLTRDRSHLVSEIECYIRTHGFPWRVTGFSGGEAILKDRNVRQFSAVFLDILMDGMDGLETARRLRELNPQVQLVFFSIEAGYALEGYEMEAVGFLLKEDIRMNERFQRLMERLERRLRNDNIVMLSAGTLPADMLVYAEVRNHDMLLYLRDGTELTQRMTLAGLRSRLPKDGRFFECYRGVIINLDAVDILNDRTVTMISGDTFPVSRRRSSALEHAYAARNISRFRRDL